MRVLPRGRGISTDLDFPTSPGSDGSWLSPERLQRNALPSGSAPANAPPRHSDTTTSFSFSFFFALASNLKGGNRSRVLTLARVQPIDRDPANGEDDHRDTEITKNATIRGRLCVRRGLRCIRHVDAERITRADALSLFLSFFLPVSFARDTSNCSRRGLGGDWARGPRRPDALSASPPTPVYPPDIMRADR